MANYMYVNLSSSTINVYGSSNPLQVVGNIRPNDMYVINSETSMACSVYFSKNGNLEFGEIRKPFSSSVMTRNDTYNSARVTLKSVDFTLLGGAHFDAQVPKQWADGFGLYGAITIIYRNGDFVGVFFRSSTLPDEIERDDTVAEGVFKFIVGTHPMAGGYKSLNLYTLDGNRTLPAAIDNASGKGVSGVNAHKGYNTERGSEGCLTIPGNESDIITDYGRYISLYTPGESGKIIVKRLVTLPSL
jgi:hypothetical protein